ncbi:MAG: helix-turn-helix transcriptional regulator [Planctomycetes bacterium]|nr:helix-turn-helix transcriptional regulator [Planctomycetota bacterium]
MSSDPSPLLPAPNPGSVGTFVRERRTAAGLTQRQLAEMVGTGTRLVSDLENDKPTLRMDAVNRVLAAFGKRLGPVDKPPEADAPQETSMPPAAAP